jgi:hypothetical protein
VWDDVDAVRQRAVPMEFQGRVASVYDGRDGRAGRRQRYRRRDRAARRLAAPFWFAFVGSAILLAVIWRQLPQIAHSEEDELARQ